MQAILIAKMQVQQQLPVQVQQVVLTAQRQV